MQLLLLFVSQLLYTIIFILYVLKREGYFRKLVLLVLIGGVLVRRVVHGVARLKLEAAFVDAELACQDRSVESCRCHAFSIFFIKHTNVLANYIC